MRNPCLALFLWGCLSTTVCAQEEGPKLLVQAAQCLEAKKLLPPSKATGLTFGYLLDEKSYPGEKVLYLVNYAAPARSNGFVFAIFLTEHDGNQVFNIQNNASFVLSKDDRDGVSFVDPPLGGTWTQEHLASAIKRIELLPRFKLRVKDLLKPPDLTQCESYTDKK